MDFTPSQFASAASAGWTSTSAQTILTAAVSDLSTTTTLTVASTYGFTVGTLNGVNCSISSTVSQYSGCSGATLTVQTTTGTATMTCKSVTTTQFGTCSETSGGAVAAASSAVVTQANVAGIQIAVLEPASKYKYSLLGSPRSGISPSALPNGPFPSLLSLGTGGLTLTGNGSYTCTLGNNGDKICVNGSIVVDGGTISCSTSGIYSSTGQISSAQGATLCNGAPVSASPVVPDPVAPLLPSCFEISASLEPIYPTNPSTDSSGYDIPGIYTGSLSGTLEPGVYVADGGVGDVTIAPPDSNDSYFSQNSSGFDSTSGVLIYLPALHGTYSSSCVTLPQGVTTLPSVSTSSLKVAPLTSAQSTYWFGGNGALGDMWLWQDKANTQQMSQASGNGAACSGKVYNYNSGSNTATANTVFSSACVHGSSTSFTTGDFFGLTYMPSGILAAHGNGQMIFGRLISGGVVPTNGAPGLTLTGA